MSSGRLSFRLFLWKRLAAPDQGDAGPLSILRRVAAITGDRHGSGIIPSGPNSLKVSYVLIPDGDRLKYVGGRVCLNFEKPPD
jgi:hypothetical protein